jgi:DNA-nicking Smr family endonuclease
MARRRRTGSPRFSSSDSLLDSEPVATIDLHGLGVEEARRSLTTVLSTLRRRHAGGVVHIVTGKGRGSAAGPVLKPLVRQLLQGPLSSLVRDTTEDATGGGYRVRLR